MKTDIRQSNRTMETGIYHNTENGLKKAMRLKTLPLYSRVYSFGPGMESDIWAVYDEQNSIVKMSENVDSYFSNPLRKMDKYGRPISQKFGIGFYWDDSDLNFRFDGKDVLQAIKKANEFVKQQEAKQLEKENSDKMELENLPAQYPHLKPGARTFAEIKSNLNAELKKRFPNQKFSLKKDGYDTLRIRWTNGVALNEVSEVAYVFENHVNDWSGYRDYAPSNFNRIFGGFEYVFPEREMSEEIAVLWKKIAAIYNETSHHGEHWAQRNLREIWQKMNIPEGACNFRIEATGVKTGLFSDCYKIGFDLPGNKKERKESDNYRKAKF